MRMTAFPHRAERGNPRRVDDPLALTRDCLALAFASAFPAWSWCRSRHPRNASARPSRTWDVILYHSHEDMARGTSVLRAVSSFAGHFRLFRLQCFQVMRAQLSHAIS